jgi:hypothetical protein
MAKIFIAMAKIFIAMAKIFIAMAKIFIAMAKIFIAMAKIFIAMAKIFIAMANFISIKKFSGISLTKGTKNTKGVSFYIQEPCGSGQLWKYMILPNSYTKPCLSTDSMVK